jgi:hypothetical protein
MNYIPRFQDMLGVPASGNIALDVAMHLRAPNTATGAGTYESSVLSPDYFAEYDGYDVRGWDGYNAEPILPETVAVARRFGQVLGAERLRKADIAPGSDGTIGLEWQLGQYVIFAEVGPTNSVLFKFIHQSGQTIAPPPIPVAEVERACPWLFLV